MNTKKVHPWRKITQEDNVVPTTATDVESPRVRESGGGKFASSKIHLDFDYWVFWAGQGLELDFGIGKSCISEFGKSKSQIKVPAQKGKGEFGLWAVTKIS